MCRRRKKKRRGREQVETKAEEDEEEEERRAPKFDEVGGEVGMEISNAASPLNLGPF